MSLRWQFTRDTRFVVPIKVEIYDSEYSGSVQTLPIVGDQPVIEQFGTRNADPLELIKGSFAEFRLRGEAGDFDDLFSRDNERFLIKLFVDGDLWSEYIPVPDTFSEPVTGGNYEIIIKGANLSLLKQVDVLDILTAGERISKLDGIYSIISHFFSIPVVDGTILYPSGANQSTSALSQIFFNVDRFDENASAYDALQWLVSKGSQIRIARGKAFVMPVLESTFTGYEYSGGAVGSGVLYNQNFASEKIGGRLATERTGLVTYSGVERVYQPGEIENIVPSGDLEEDDFELALGLRGEPDNPARLPIGWEYVTTPRPQPPVSVRTDRNEWKIGIIAGLPNTEYSFDAETETFINTGQRLQFKLRGRYENLRDKDTTFVLRVVVRVGDLYLSDPQGRGGVLNWVSDSNATVRIPLSENAQSDYQIFTTPIPTGGDVSYRVIINRDNASAGGNFVYLSEIKSLIADENGDVITEIDTLAGERGQVYEYNEQFGDGVTSISPGALFFDGDPTETWNIIGIPDGSVANLPLGDIQTKYLASELLRDRERITGTVDTFDTIALIDSKRVNYTRIDWRYGRSQIELVEIEEHNLTATTEDRKVKDPNEGISVVGDPFFLPESFYPFASANSIGIITQDYENTTTETIEAELSVPMRSGIEYLIVNESQLSREDRQAGIYPVVPIFGASDTRIDYPTGTVDIEEQIIDAPSGSLIFKAPGQAEIDDNIGEEKDEEFDERIVDLNNELDVLEADLNTLNTVTLPALNDDLDQLEIDLNTLNTVTIPGLESDISDNDSAINTLNTVTLPNLQAELDDVLPITETKISDNAISAPKLQANSVVAGKIAANAVVANSIAANAVTTNKINAGAIVADKISAGAVVAEKIATDAVIANKIAAGAIIAGKIGADAIVANNISAGAITAEKIQANTITANEINTDNLAANSAFIEELMAQQLILRTGGFIRSTSYSPGVSGLLINADGNAEFNDVTIRGTLDTVTLDDEMIVNGSIFVPNNTSPDVAITTTGMHLRTGSGFSSQRAINFRDTVPSGTLRGAIYAETAVSALSIVAQGSWDVNIQGGSGGGFINLNGLPTSSPGGTNRLWKDGSGFLRIT